MEGVPKKLEVMLSKIQKMNVNMLGLWFPNIDKEEILKNLNNSNKFKVEGDYVRIKTYEEIYEEELRKKLEDEKRKEELAIEKKEEEKVVDMEANEEHFIINKNDNMKKEMELEKINLENEIEMQVKPFDIKKINGAEFEYEDILRIIEEYNENVQFRLEKFDGKSFETKAKAIEEFYENKYELEEEIIEDTSLEILMYSLINKKKKLDSGYVVICEVLNEEIVDYMSENYTDEVIYFCPINGETQEFEFDLNEFFIKDTRKIFTKYLKKCVITEEKDLHIQKVEIVTGN